MQLNDGQTQTNKYRPIVHFGKKYSAGGKTYETKISDNFIYVDLVDKSVSTKQEMMLDKFNEWNISNVMINILFTAIFRGSRMVFDDGAVLPLCDSVVVQQ